MGVRPLFSCTCMFELSSNSGDITAAWSEPILGYWRLQLVVFALLQARQPGLVVARTCNNGVGNNCFGSEVMMISLHCTLCNVHAHGAMSLQPRCLVWKLPQPIETRESIELGRNRRFK